MFQDKPEPKFIDGLRPSEMIRLREIEDRLDQMEAEAQPLKRERQLIANRALQRVRYQAKTGD